MDYVLGSVAALVTGNVTPNRPKLIKRALTPTKHQPSPNVTPKSECVDDRSIFLSPSMKKKKAIVKKSPKRIFENPDLETTDCGDGNVSLSSPKADKVKKHLKDDLDKDNEANKSLNSKSPKGKNKTHEQISSSVSEINVSNAANKNSPTKKRKLITEEPEDLPVAESKNDITENPSNVSKSPKKKKRKSVTGDDSSKIENKVENEKVINKSEETQINEGATVENATIKKKKNRKNKKKNKGLAVQELSESNNVTDAADKENVEIPKESPKKGKKKNKKPKVVAAESNVDKKEDNQTEITKKSKTKVNPNAVTDKDSDSEHESDDDIESENEEINKEVFASEPAAEESSDDEEETVPSQESQKQPKPSKEASEVNTEDDIKRTLFVGNVPFSTKCKKEIKKIFNKHGQIETIRIRTVPIKDGRYTAKLAVIKNELHPERSTVNVYIKYAQKESIEKALVENNTVLNEHHLRVTRSTHTGAEHDPKSSVFVGNLPFALEDETLRQKFESCGEIESVRIIRDKKTNAGKGFGYVNFASKDGVELALALTDEDLTIKNRIIRVKRCTQTKSKQNVPDNKNKKPFNNQKVQTNQRQNFDNKNNRVQGGQRQQGGFQRNNQGGPRQGGPRQGGPRPGGPRQGGPGGPRQGGPGGPRQGGPGGPRQGGPGGPRHGGKDQEGGEGAFRRIMNKRKNPDGGPADGPPNKRQKNINQPNREKKSRKEFVGMTAEKKKKRKFDKGQKQKKKLSEILTK